MNVQIRDKQNNWLKINDIRSFLSFDKGQKLKFYGKNGKIFAIVDTKNIADIWVGDSKLERRAKNE